MKTLLVSIAFLIAACSQPTTAATTPTPSSSPPTTSPIPTAVPSPTPPTLTGTYAVIVNNFLAEPGTPYTLSIVAADGHVAASTTARKRTVAAVQVGNLSTSDTTVYYLDGDSDVRFLRPDQSTGLVTHITLGSKQVAAFSVSPDDLRIAVSVLDYTRYPVSTRLYVEDLHGGGNHVQLFYSSTLLEWPAGWHAGRLVMALGINSPPQNSFDSFEAAHGYHVVNAQTGARLLTVCAGKESYVPESAGGAVCIDLQTGSMTSWDGQSHALPIARKPDATSGNCSLIGPLSPAGVIATNTVSSSQGGCGGGPGIFLVAPTGGISAQPVTSRANASGWIDATHLVVDAGVFTTNSSTPLLSIVNVNTGASARIQAPGYFVAILPGAL
ncbi:MAG: hypothetical protein QOH92_3040 [Chloroflexota bacterium]|nr:hypothetical protein [Chloroflexota bacterium]